MSQWCVFGESVLGASHRQSGLPNQDAMAWLPEEGLELPLLLVVADGHGSAIRGHEGSRLAIEVAQDAACELLFSKDAPTDLIAVKEFVEQRLPRELGSRWIDRVRCHLGEKPFSPAEILQLEQVGESARKLSERNFLKAYGSTLLFLVVTPVYVAYLQIGDGDMVTVSETGTVGRPLPGDPRLFANETTSLSSEQNWKDFRVFLQPISEGAPALILACTDGFDNSFPSNDNAVPDFAAEIWKHLSEHGVEAVKASLNSLLTETTEKGSGDDITIGMICRLSAFNKAQPA